MAEEPGNERARSDESTKKKKQNIIPPQSPPSLVLVISHLPVMLLQTLLWHTFVAGHGS